MEITLAIKYIYPDLEFWTDFEVLDDNQWEWPYIKWYNKDIIQPTQEELLSAWVEVEKIQKKEEIIKSFNTKVKEYNSAYPIEEQKLFAQKISKAEKVLAWWDDVYISAIANAKWVTPIDIATYIKAKSDAFEIFYAEAEIERDTEIYLLNN